MTTSFNRLGVARETKRRVTIKRPTTTTIQLNNNDRFLKELTSASCDGKPTTYLIRVHSMKRGNKTTTLVMRTTKG